MSNEGKRKRVDRRGSNPRRLPYMARAEDIASELGFDPLRLPVLLMAEHDKKLTTWLESLQMGRIPDDLVMVPGMTLGRAKDIWFREAAAYMPLAAQWTEYFHGKKQRIEQVVDAEVTQNVVSAEPISREEFESDLAAARRAADATDSMPDT